MSYQSHPPAAATTIATLTTDEQSALRVADLVADEFFADDGAISLVDAGQGQWRVTFYFRHETDERRSCVPKGWIVADHFVPFQRGAKPASSADGVDT